MADMSVQLAIEATNNARSALAQAASDVSRLGGAFEAARGRANALGASTAALTKRLAAARSEALALSSALRNLPGGVGGGPASTGVAGGGSFVTTRPTLMLVGDNPGGRERVDVTPLSGRGQTRVAPGSGLIRAAGGASVVAGGGRPITVDMTGVGDGIVDRIIEEVVDRFAAAGVGDFNQVLDV